MMVHQRTSISYRRKRVKKPPPERTTTISRITQLVLLHVAIVGAFYLMIFTCLTWNANYGTLGGGGNTFIFKPPADKGFFGTNKAESFSSLGQSVNNEEIAAAGGVSSLFNSRPHSDGEEQELVHQGAGAGEDQEVELEGGEERRGGGPWGAKAPRLDQFMPSKEDGQVEVVEPRHSSQGPREDNDEEITEASFASFQLPLLAKLKNKESKQVGEQGV